MKKIFCLILILLLLPITACDEILEKPKVTQNTLAEEEACFNFFYETQNTMANSKGYGLIPDRYPSNGLASIASVGFGLAGIAIGVENGWITRAEGEKRVLDSLVSLEKLDRIEGFYYHFYSQVLGTPSPGSEISNIDTAIFIAGALTAGEYFGGEVKKVANSIYEDINWPWYINPKTNQFYMGYDPVKEKFSGAWDVYGEQLMMYFLAAGSPTYPIEKKVYDSFKRLEGTYAGETFINSWFGSIFTYQFSHAFVDFRNIVDDKGINWYDNSVKATKASRQFCIDNKNIFKTFSELSWGLTACDTPNNYNGQLGAAPSGDVSYAHVNDGTVALAGAVGSMPFLPKEIIQTLEYFYSTLDGKLVGKYGLYDAYNLEKDKPWIAKDVIGIDKGITLLMIENYRSDFVWKYFNQGSFMEKAIDVLGFKKVEGAKA